MNIRENSMVNDEPNLVDFLIAVARHKKLVLATAAVVTAASVAVAVALPPLYSARATIMPPQQQSSSVSALLGQLGGLAGAAGSIAGLKNPNDLYVGMIQSRTVTDNIIAQFSLKERYDVDTLHDTRKTFEKKRRIFSGKDGMISVEVDDKDPKVAADIANRHVHELMILTQTLAVTEAAQRRAFFEKQLRAAKDELAKAEVEMRKTQESTGMLQLGSQVQSVIASAAQLRGMIAAKEVTLSSMSTFATARNPELMRVQQEIRALKGQLAEIEKGQQKGGLAVPGGKLPEVGVEYVRRLRDVKYYETMFEMLAKQFELAKIDEAKDASSIQQLDKAIPADKEASPRRKYVVAGGAVAGLLLGVLLAFLRSAKDTRGGGGGRTSKWFELFGLIAGRPAGVKG